MTEKLPTLKDDGVKMVDYSSQLRESVEAAALSWQDFCALPSDVKQQFGGADKQWTVGYESKDGSGPNGDRKENFDFSVAAVATLRQVLEGVDEPAARQFLASVETLGEQAVPMIEAFGRELEADYGVDGFGDLAKKSAGSAFFRFLHYPSGQAVGGTIAEPHVDHSGFTFHLFETTDGCERLTRSGEWELLPVADGQAATFASMQTQLVTRGEIKALPHRVVANETSARMGRFAIVCFVALADTPSYDRKTHGRLQEMTPGFNYAMPYDEFKTLFKQS